MHTKGKWTVANSGGKVIVGGMMHPKTIATLETTPLKITPEIEANARLIAAAPRLLAACNRYVQQVESSVISLNQCKDSVMYNMFKEAIEAAESEV